ncbi:Alpha/Beta hydrolase protein [Hygrophoropsis aurantiaca]|uniref:Alpha/Beta hydrolase protein n=1 Tax=Hygrophoropsis aurantiaca TaxID=72124 RepID=A0ACB8A5N4_9AGAM|nr:Alpha/Beta hydrolase protein [Hygrophoropsis aurantiaca]
MQLSRKLTGLLTLLTFHLQVQAQSAPTVDLGYASYQGAVDTTTNITSFLGIRYAAPPIGDLRWQAPQPPATVSGVQQATTQPNECYQAPTGNSSTNPFIMSKRAVVESEDCLFLNVYTPGDSVSAASSGDGLPVVVWIHGGGYIAGAASGFNGADLIVDSNYNVITVLIQYRLGLFGFLPGEAVKADGALNAGLLDQNYALQWVQEHIAAFGGDPAKVTIWGESAGAGSVLQHLVAHGGNTQPPLFRAAMTSSTFLPSQYGYNEQIPEMLYNEVATGANCTTLACLREAPVDALQTLNYNLNLAGFYGASAFVPVVDGTFIVERPTVTIAKGKLNGEALLSVTNTYEGTIFVNLPEVANTDVDTYATTLFPGFGPEQSAEAAGIYGATMLGATDDALAIGVMGESIFICPTYYLLKAFGSRAWKGEFAIPPGEHGNDIPYYFTSQNPPYNNAQFITAFSGGFLSFATSMDVNQKVYADDITPQWNSWSEGMTEMLFNETAAGAPVVQPTTTSADVLARCASQDNITIRIFGLFPIHHWAVIYHGCHNNRMNELLAGWAVIYHGCHNNIDQFSGCSVEVHKQDQMQPVESRQQAFSWHRLHISLIICTGNPKSCHISFSRQLAKLISNSQEEAKAQSAPTVNLGYASYQGAVDTTTNTTSFLGIRYAAPPIGDLRWQAPQPPATVSGVQQATTQPNECYQAPTGNSSTNPFIMSKRAVVESEDCLFLNVYTPGGSVSAASSGDGLPVVVWIHGGGYIAGAASSYNGADLIVDSNYNVIIVLIQYRLGLFEHIAAFGGDPAKVTIWGESAGAGSVLQHLVAHGGNTQPPLFRAAITSSTFLPSQYGYNEQIPEMLYNEVATGANCTTLACLREAPVDALQTLNYNLNLAGFYGASAFVPVVDGTFIVERPTVTIAKGKLNGEALLSVTNTYEGTIFVNLPEVANTDVDTYATTLFPGFGPEQSAEAAGIYGATMPGATDDALAIGVMGESTFICPTYYLLKAFGSRAWKGEFAIPPGEHGDDIPYYFTSQNPPYNNSQFITAFSGGFLSFATSMDVNQKVYADDITPQWNSWSEGMTQMLFNETTARAPVVQPTTTSADVLARCAFWDSVAAYSAQ